MNYPRKLLPILQKQIDSREIIVVTGMRRVGKTTLLQMLFNEIESENKAFLDLENPIEQKIFEEKNYHNIWSNLQEYGISPEKKAYLFLDEIQAMPEIVKAIKYLYDHDNVKFFCTGSSSFYLKNLFPESLAGRKFIFELYPLDFEEFLVFKSQPRDFYHSFAEKETNKSLVRHEKVKGLYEEYLNYGGFPGVVREKDSRKKKLKLNDIFKSYFEKDVRNLADFREINAFRDLILLLMQRVGSKLDITKLSSEISVSRETVYSYLSFLEGTYFISLISPYTLSVDREVSGTKKVYFCDSGLLNHLSQLTPGHLFENSVFNSLRKYGHINYYQKRSGAEIDFIINKDIALEVKTKGTLRDLRKLKKISQSLNLSEHYLISKDFVGEKGFLPATEL